MKAVNNQLDMFGALLSGEDLPVPTHHIKVDKPLFITEFFAGYGSQSLALKYLGVEFKHNIISEWAVKSIQAYKDLHYSEDRTDYSQGKTIEEIRSFLYGRISRDYNSPLTNEQIDKMKESEARLIYSNMVCTHNLGSIVGIKAEELGLKKENYNLVTYSFPCQDLSNAGKLAGINENTRSGLLLQVERLLRESIEKGLPLPDLLMMENVPGVHGARTMEAWNSWLNFLNSIGYHNAWQDCNAKDYGIPQSRNRCFMFSWLNKEGYYEFPKTIPLTMCLRDMLEDNVGKEFYLKPKMLEYIVSEDDAYKVNKKSMVVNRTIACSKTTREGVTRAEKQNEITDTALLDCYNRKVNTEVAQTIDTRVSAGNNTFIVEKTPKVIAGIGEKKSNSGTQWYEQDRIYDDGVATTVATSYQPNYAVPIKCATKQGYLLAEDGDGIDISTRLQNHRGTVQKGMSQTIKTQPDIGVLTINGEAYAIRKLTPKECFRLMGVKDCDYELIARNQSRSSLYHLAGDSIVCNGMLTALLGQLF